MEEITGSAAGTKFRATAGKVAAGARPAADIEKVIELTYVWSATVIWS